MYDITKKAKVCIHKAFNSYCTSARVAPIELIRTKPLMPNVEGNSHEKAFQNIGILLAGHEMPLAKSNGTDMNTNITINDSLSCAKADTVMLKNMHDSRYGTMNASSVCHLQIWIRSKIIGTIHTRYTVTML